jgi:cell division protein FtsW
VLLTILGLVAVADASAPQALNFFGDELYFFKQQAVWALLGLVLMTISSFIKYTIWEKLATPLFFINLLLLTVVLIPGVGLSIYGARRWIALGPISFQPSELIKITLTLYIAKVASSEKGPLSYFIPVVAVASLIMLEPDLGTTIIVCSIAFVQIFISGVSLLYFVGAGILATGASVVLILTSEYRRARLATFFESTTDPLGSAYHIRQVLLALGSGGLFGVGLGHSRQKYLFLPEAATDSILAVLAEELGFLGVLVLISLLAFFVYRAIRVAERAPSRFAKIASVGILSWIAIQVVLNIGSMTAILPLTGVPLPFISYGGTALTTVLFATGILLNISRYAKQDS